ncbi:MAG: helix-turn-helix transcriptional regulator [Lachnospiraceae bacterium]|nr:helix-turn-helix transcriptional regulator [Lachnospiraceae bacterium]
MAAQTDGKTPLGKLILKNLYLKGKNQAWLAKQISVSENHISIICSKTKSPKIETLLKISRVLNINADELLEAVSENLKTSIK